MVDWVTEPSLLVYVWVMMMVVGLGVDLGVDVGF